MAKTKTKASYISELNEYLEWDRDTGYGIANASGIHHNLRTNSTTESIIYACNSILNGGCNGGSQIFEFCKECIEFLESSQKNNN